MSGLKLSMFVVGWVFASLAIGVVIAIVLTEALSLIGVVDTGEPSYSVSLNVITLLIFLALIAVPIVFRRRFL